MYAAAMPSAAATRKAFFDKLAGLITLSGGDYAQLRDSFRPLAAEAASIGKLKEKVAPSDAAADTAAEKAIFKRLLLEFTTDSTGGHTEEIDAILDGLAGV